MSQRYAASGLLPFPPFPFPFLTYPRSLCNMEQSDSLLSSMLQRLLKPNTTLVPALVGSLICYLSLPPAGLSLLAWVGTIPWLGLILLNELPGKKPYLKLWLAGFVFWLLTVHWIRLVQVSFPMNYVALLSLTIYLGLALPSFVALTRIGVHRWRLPLALVAPVTYVGIDWLRGWLLTGFSLGSLCHSQAHHTSIIQIAELTGEYGVTFLLIFAASVLTIAMETELARRQGLAIRPQHFLPGVVLVATLVIVLLYGDLHASHYNSITSKGPHRLTVALIQGDIRPDWKQDPARQQQIMDEYVGLSMQAVKGDSNIGLVIWPETAFRESLISLEPGYTPPVEQLPPERLSASTDYLKALIDSLQSSVLVGVDRWYFFPDEAGELAYHGYNSSIMMDRQGKNLGTYDKMHLVPFGEYIPFADWIPWMYLLTPVAGGAVPGEQPTGMLLDEVLFVPNICYESAVPRLIRRQVNSVAAEYGRHPDVLVNLTNDAWYLGSSQLDQHLACSIFRAVEMRMPHLMVANGGLTAHIDATGSVVQVTERQSSTYLIADVALGDHPPTLYSRWGNWLALPCVVCCVALAVSNIASSRKSNADRREPEEGDASSSS